MFSGSWFFLMWIVNACGFFSLNEEEIMRKSEAQNKELKPMAYT